MNNSLKINVIKAGKPGVSYNQRLMCYLLEALNMMYQKIGYSTGMQLRNPDEERFVNIFVKQNGFSFKDYCMDGALFSFNISIPEILAEKILENYHSAKPEYRQIGLVMDIMATQNGSDLVTVLRELKHEFGIMSYNQ